MMTNSGVLAITAVSVTASSVASAQRIPTSGYNSHMWGDNYGWSMMGHGTMFVFWILVIVLIVLAVRWPMDRDGNRNGGNNALDILKERLARGEIDPAEYEERRKVVENNLGRRVYLPALPS